MSKRRFAIFLLTHARPESLITLESLRQSGYSGKVYLLVDNEDPTRAEYREKFAGSPIEVIEFDKAAIDARTDTADTRTDRRAAIFARNASFEIARDLGLTHFLQLDDDYTDFLFRFVDEDGTVRGRAIANIDPVIDATLDLLDDTGALAVAWSQGGDHMSGADVYRGYIRKAMNSWFVRVDRPFEFVGRMNDDVNTYLTRGGRGDLFLTVLNVQLNQITTQAEPGGMTDIYRAAGTYVKTFYSVMMAPAVVKVGTMGTAARRFHHITRWDNAVPKILAESCRRS